MRRALLLGLVYGFFPVHVAAIRAGPLVFDDVPSLMQKRQDDSTTQTSVTSTSQSQAATTSQLSEATASTTGSQVTTGATETGTSGSSTKPAASTTTTSADDAWEPGGIAVITSSSGTSTYFKVGDYVTFKWDYTSLSVTPSAVDVMASCSGNDHLYTIALNQSVEAPGAATWDTGNYQQTATVPLLTETYTLVVYDAANSISASVSAGYLGTSDQYTFGMYLPQAYTPLNEIKCVTCANGALSTTERQALGFVFAMATISLLSFTWFVGGLGASF